MERNMKACLRGIRKRMIGWGLIGLLAGAGISSFHAADIPKSLQIVPLRRAHAHNDYAHPHPLFDALACGFCSVEADVHLIDGKLLVAHDRWQVRPDRTLERLYLQPLWRLVQTNHGRVYPGGPDVTLLIDIKSEAEATWKALQPLLERYRPMLTVFRKDKIQKGAVTVILSGNRPIQTLARLPERLAAIDGRLPDLDRNPPVSLVPLISDSWRRGFSWRGNGPIPESDRQRLLELVHRAHAQGRRIRFWAAPDSPVAWELLYDAGVDLINTDHLQALQRFLLQKQKEANASGTGK